MQNLGDDDRDRCMIDEVPEFLDPYRLGKFKAVEPVIDRLTRRRGGVESWLLGRVQSSSPLRLKPAEADVQGPAV
jgi:hypothetical protein